MAIRSVSVNNGMDWFVGVGVVVDSRRASSTWEPVGERASVWIGSCMVGEDGKRRRWISFLRNGIGDEGVGRRAA